jgi:hypothetical protein
VPAQHIYFGTAGYIVIHFKFPIFCAFLFFLSRPLVERYFVAVVSGRLQVNKMTPLSLVRAAIEAKGGQQQHTNT